jgi:XRE family transcriptional regulator, regulator of sulfur utilization
VTGLAGVVRPRCRKLFGKRVRAIRRAGITQEDAAERAKIHPKYLGEIERGEKRPSFEAIVALADALGTSAAAFFHFENEESNERALRKKIDALIGDASVEELQRVYRLLRALLEP